MPTTTHPVTRRTFLRTSATVAAAGATLATVTRPWTARAAQAPDPVNVAFVGVNGKGRDDRAEILKAGGRVAALCDVDADSLDAAAAEHEGASTYRDFRTMLEREKGIDAVVVSTPDHCHAPAAMMAMKLGKHVYCQKPLTHDIYEARALADAARTYKVATQMGNQGHASPNLRRLVDWLKGGLIGTVHEAHVWSDRPTGWWPQGVGRPAEAPVPAHLDWDAWLGPAPHRPYAPGYHPFAWRGFTDFGTGALGDMGCHLIDPAVWALDLTGPCTVRAESTGMTVESYPTSSTVAYDFPERAGRPPVMLVWYDGGNRPERPPGLPDDLWPTTRGAGGALFVGDKGLITRGLKGEPILLDDTGKPVPAGDFTPPDPRLPESPGHYVEWINACRGGPAPLCNFDYAGPLTETVLLGNVALRLGKKVDWDPVAMKVAGAPEADALVRREYRAGWEL
jgi:predicted dehydrogenase